MFANWIDPVVKDYLFHDSPWRNAAARRTLWIIVAVVAVLGILGWRSVLGGESPLVILQWVPFAIVGSILGYLIVSFLDRERRVGYFHFLTILSVMLVTGPVAAFFNDLTDPPVKFILVGFFEEGFKILPVLLLAVYVPNLIRTRKDGIIYGALAGIGFNIIEIGAYINKALGAQNTVQEALVTHLTRLGIFGLGGHIIWSAFVGLGVGIAVESNKTGWTKWKYVVIYFLLAAVAHSAFDLGALLLGMMAVLGIEALFGVDINTALNGNAGTFGPLNNAMRFGTYFYNVVFIIVLFIQIKRSFATEQTLQEKELSSETPPVITKEELTQLKAERFFFKRRYKEYPKQVSSKMVLYQNLLAMQKHVARQEGRALDDVEPVTALRQAVQSLRG